MYFSVFESGLAVWQWVAIASSGCGVRFKSSLKTLHCDNDKPKYVLFRNEFPLVSKQDTKKLIVKGRFQQGSATDWGADEAF